MEHPLGIEPRRNGVAVRPPALDIECVKRRGGFYRGPSRQLQSSPLLVAEMGVEPTTWRLWASRTTVALLRDKWGEVPSIPHTPCQFMVHRSRLFRKLGSMFYIPYGRGKWLRHLDSNQDRESQSLMCYLYTMPHYYWSAIWDSNPWQKLGRLLCYHYTNGTI